MLPLTRRYIMYEIYKYHIRSDKTFKFECEYDDYIINTINEDKLRYANELSDVLSSGGSEDDVWCPPNDWYPLNGLFVYKVDTYLKDGAKETHCGHEFVVVEGCDLPNDALTWIDDKPVGRKKFTLEHLIGCTATYY